MKGDGRGNNGASTEIRVSGDTVLGPTTWCVVREQHDEYLVYNSRTDELHLISPQARYMYLLCDGLRTVSEIQTLLGAGTGEAVTGFLNKLVERGVLEPVPDDVDGPGDRPGGHRGRSPSARAGSGRAHRFTWCGWPPTAATPAACTAHPTPRAAHPTS